MDEETTSLQLALIVGFVVVALGFLLFIQNGGFLTSAIERAIDDGRVILGMSKDDVSRSWGYPYDTEEHRVQALDVDELATSTWLYKNPEREVYFSSNEIVIWVDTSLND